MSHTTRRSWFYWLIALYAAGHLMLLIPMAFDLVTHPLAQQLLNNPTLNSILFVIYRLLLGLLVAPASLVIGLLILRRAGGNMNGLFLFLHSALVMGATLRTDAPLAPVVAALNTGWMGLWLMGVYFPDGRAAFPRFEGWINTVCTLEIVAAVVWPLFRPGPLFVATLALLRPVEDGAQMVLLLVVALLTLPSLVMRYRRGDVRTRLQIRWLAWTFGLLTSAGIVLFALGILQDSSGAFERYGPIAAWVALAFAIFVFLAPVIAVGSAILRHRLYDIDIIIRRTLVYSTLTAILAAVYFVCVVLVQQVLRALTGQASDLALVVSTLAVAALFSPLRRRLQDLIDRRFYRRKYDAVKALEVFTLTARDEVSPQQLAVELIDAVDATMQPTQLQLWLQRMDRDQQRLAEGPGK